MKQNQNNSIQQHLFGYLYSSERDFVNSIIRNKVFAIKFKCRTIIVLLELVIEFISYRTFS